MKNKILLILIYINIFFTLIILSKDLNFLLGIHLGILFLIAVIRKQSLTYKVLGIVFLPFIFFSQFTFFINLMIKKISDLIIIFYIIYIIGMIGLIIPLVQNLYGLIRRPIYRLIGTFWLSISIFGAGQPELDHLSYEGVIVGLNRSDLVKGIVILIYMYLVIKRWGYEVHFNLPIDFSKYRNIIILVVTMITGIWFCLFVVFSSIAINYKAIFENWDFSLINPTLSDRFKNSWEIYFSAIEASLVEESERCINLILIFTILKKQKFRLELSILCSSLLFALPHIFNVFSIPPYKLSFEEAIYQVFFTFGFGCYLAVVFLYTGKLWIVILFHIIYDSLVSSITPLGISGSLILSRISYTMVVTIGWLLLAAIIFILNKKIIKENIILLTERRNEKILS